MRLAERGYVMSMWKFKSCPRCEGDMLLNRDHYGWYEQCIQCSYLNELKDIAEFKEQPEKKEKELVRTVGTRRKR